MFSKFIGLFSSITLVAGALVAYIVIPPVNPLKDLDLYINPQTQVSNWITTNPGDGRVTEFKNKLASQPHAIWFTGGAEDSTNLTRIISESAAQNTVPVFVLYNIPHRDCNAYSSGGASDANAYRQWISSIATTIASNKAIIIVEPDALPNSDCLTKDQQTERYTLMSQSVETLAKNKNAYVYIDAGHPSWKEPADMAERLKKAGIAHAQGFSLNVSNFYTTDEVSAYGVKIAHHFLGKKSFIIDTSRNGNGATSDNQWCNPAGRSLGSTPTTTPNIGYVDALLWIKSPGESDGTCNGGPNAGLFWPDYANSLIYN